MGRVVGRVVVAHSGVGLPGVVVSILSGASDATTTPTERRPPIEIANARRLGSAITTRDGAFSIDLADTRGASADLVIVVTGPDDSDRPSENSVLYVSQVGRRSGAEEEAFLIQIAGARLEQAGLPVPERRDSAGTVIEHATQESAFRRRTSESIRGVLAEELAGRRAIDSAADAAARRLQAAASRVTDDDRNEGAFVRPGASISSLQKAAVERVLAVQTQSPLRLRYRLTADQREVLGLGSEPGTRVPTDALDAILFGSQDGGARDLTLERRSMADMVCRGSTPVGELCGNREAPTEGTSPRNGGGAAVFDEQTYIARLLGNIQAPDPAVATKLRPDVAHTQDVIDRLKLRGGPADTAALYDFYHLEIALEGLWQEVLDPGLGASAKELFLRIVELGGTVPDAGSAEELLEATRAEVERIARMHPPPAVVVQVFGVSGDQWQRLTFGEQTALRQLASTAAAIALEPEAHMPGAEKEMRRQGEELLAAANDRPTLPQLLAELERRADEQYSFTVFAANRRERSVNFGLLVNYRQKWDPLAYQVGRLVKTVPLAPKETRRYSTKLTTKQSRAQRELESHLEVRRGERSTTGRLEAEVVRNAQTTSNFTRTAEGGVQIKAFNASGSASASTSRATTLNEAKKQFREEVEKSAEEIKNERSLEVTTSSAAESESSESGEISNPNDELTVTYLFYELQRRYRVSEAIHRLTPVVLVAQEVPRPDQLDEAWLVRHDWILKRVILDDSYLPALAYLTTGLVGDQMELEQLQRYVAELRRLVMTLKADIEDLNASTLQRYAALEKVLQPPWGAGGGGGGSSGGFLGGLLRLPGEVAKAGARFLASDSGTNSGETRETAARDAAERAARAEADARDRLERAQSSLATAVETYARALAGHHNRKAEIARLRLHVRDNILYYMQAIWSHEPPDQRFFRLHRTKVPQLQGARHLTTAGISTVGTGLPHLAGLAWGMLNATFAPEPYATEELAKVADLDNLLGFRGNYMVFALRRANVLTDMMSLPYADPLVGLREPDERSTWTLGEFVRYVCCLKEQLKATEFAALKTALQAEYEAIVRTAQNGNDEIVLPTDQLFIEALPGVHPLLEDYKLAQRAMDVRKTTAEVRFAELENVRAAARLVHDERRDPKIDKTILVEGGGVPPVLPVDD